MSTNEQNSPEYLWEGIWPSREIHLLAGPSGAGKTRWLLHLLKNEWEKGIKIFGRETHPVPWCYVAADRSLASVHRTLKDIDIDPHSINIIPCWGKNRLSYCQVQDAIKNSGARLAVIEGFPGFSDGDRSYQIRPFLCSTQKWLEQDDLTIIGVAESPKMKPFEKYENPRQRISGCAAWAHYSDAIMLVEPADSKDPSKPDRSLYICPRNGAGIVAAGAFDCHGKIVFHINDSESHAEVPPRLQVNPFKQVN